MNTKCDQLNIRGKAIEVPSLEIEGRTVVVRGHWLRVASIKDEDWIEGDLVPDSASFVSQLCMGNLKPDIFSFPESVGVETRGLEFPFTLDNAAAIDSTHFKAWWDGLPQETRKNVRRAEKRGVIIKVSLLDDKLVAGIKSIYDEMPIRQGRRFWHFGKSLEQIKRENGTYADRSRFICAYYNGDLIGFIKLVYVGNIARIMQVLTLNLHNDKRPIHALMAKAVEICNADGASWLIYSKYTYGNKKNDTMVEFKRRLGFQPVYFRRYFVPLTLKGKIALKFGLQREKLEILPEWTITLLLTLRSYWLNWRHGTRDIYSNNEGAVRISGTN